MKAGSTKAQHRCHIAVTRNGDGSYNVAFAATNIRPVSCRRGTMLKLLDVEQIVPVTVEFDGVHVRPKLILKMFRKFCIHDAKSLAIWNKASGQKPQLV